jgi:hypothetical protein
MKYLPLLLLFSLNACSSKETKNNYQEKQTIAVPEDSEILKPYIEHDSVGRLLAEGFLNEQELFEGELTIYTHSLGRYEILNMHNDTMVGYICEYDTNGTLRGYKNYMSPSIWGKGDINEMLMYDSTGTNYHKKSIYVDISKCFKNDSLLEFGTVKAMPLGISKLEVKNISNTSSVFEECKFIGNGEFEVVLSQSNVKYGDTLEFLLDDGGSVFKPMKLFDYYTPTLD